jgi:dihydrofolate synthase / folylpolyglutamate synthase
VLGKEFEIENYEPLANGEGFALKTPYETFEHLQLNMLGYHQVKNAALAVMAVCYLKEKKKLSIFNEQIMKGIQHTKWNGRFETVNEHPLTIVDGAHNAEGIDSLLSTLRLHYEGRNIHLVFSCLNDKSADRMVQELETIAASITFTSFDFPRARAAQELYEMSTHHDKHMNEEWKKAIAYVQEKATGEQDMIVITGSLYFISEVRAFLLK